MILKYVCILLPCSICFMCVFFNVFFFKSSNLYLNNTVLSVLFCVNKDIIICYSDCLHRGSHLVEPLCYDVI